MTDSWPDGHDIPEYTCTVCGLPSVRLSVGGPGICPACDCGSFRNGQEWTFRDAMLVVKTASEEQRMEFHRRARKVLEPSSGFKALQAIYSEARRDEHERTCPYCERIRDLAFEGMLPDWLRGGSPAGREETPEVSAEP